MESRPAEDIQGQGQGKAAHRTQPADMLSVVDIHHTGMTDLADIQVQELALLQQRYQRLGLHQIQMPGQRMRASSFPRMT